MNVSAIRRFVIRIYGDSLSLPRVAEGVAYYKTYPELFAARWRKCRPGSEVYLYNRSFSGASAPQLYQTYRSDSFYFGESDGDVMILQCGIVDCAPRPIPSWLRTIVGRTPSPLRRIVVDFLHTHRAQMLRMGLLWRVTPPDEFLQCMTQILTLACRDFKRIYVVNIAPTTAEMELQSPGLTDGIRMYNLLIEKALSAGGDERVVLIDVHQAILDGRGALEASISRIDGHHITQYGHRLYLRLISQHEARFGLIEIPPEA